MNQTTEPHSRCALGHEPNLVDWWALSSSVIVVMIISGFIFLLPEQSGKIIDWAFQFITKSLGSLFVMSGIVTTLGLLALALSPWRKIKLGPPDETPRYSLFSWAGMLFSTGIGTTVLYWGTIEWIEYYLSPPFAIEARSPEAHRWAMSYGMFHWGLLGWGFYALPAVCISYAYHVRGALTPSLAAACAPLLGHQTQRWPGRIINALFMIGLIGSASTGLGLTTPLITESLKSFFGVNTTFGYTIGAIAVIVIIIAASVSLGLDQGIKRLSTINLVLMLVLLGLIYVLGPTQAITEQGLESVQFMFSNFVAMCGWYYPEKNQVFTESWTVFYWAWWISFAPFVGIFICKISRGRTLGELIWGILVFGTLGCSICFIVFGGYASYLEFEMGDSIIETFRQDRHAAILKVVTSLPTGKWILPLFLLLCISFAATTYDSASYTLALSATRSVGVNEEPARWHRVLWALTLGVLPLALLSIGQESEVLVALQTASVVVALPMLLITIGMVISFILDLRKPH